VLCSPDPVSREKVPLRRAATMTLLSTFAGGDVPEELIVTFRWQRHPGGRPTATLRDLARRALARLGVARAEVGVLICDDATMQALNRSYRKHDRPTDVLSFEGSDPEPGALPYLGDVAISLDTAARQAAGAGHPVLRELEILLLHAVIHLCGHDHEKDRGEMSELERRLRNELLA
jgi:probable rRNA maturation factor